MVMRWVDYVYLTGVGMGKSAWRASITLLPLTFIALSFRLRPDCRFSSLTSLLPFYSLLLSPDLT